MRGGVSEDSASCQMVIAGGQGGAVECCSDRRTVVHRPMTTYGQVWALWSCLVALSPVAATDALRIPITKMGGSLTDEAVGLLVTRGECYPYFLQEYGKAIWDAAPQAPFTLVDAEVAVEIGRIALDDGFLPSRGIALRQRNDGICGRWRSCPIRPPLGAVAAHMGSDASGVSGVCDSLIRKGLI